VFYAGRGFPHRQRDARVQPGNLYEPANRPNIPVNNTYAIDASNALTVYSHVHGQERGRAADQPG